jgi:hypothetical protein
MGKVVSLNFALLCSLIVWFGLSGTTFGACINLGGTPLTGSQQEALRTCVKDATGMLHFHSFNNRSLAHWTKYVQCSFSWKKSNNKVQDKQQKKPKIYEWIFGPTANEVIHLTMKPSWTVLSDSSPLLTKPGLENSTVFFSLDGITLISRHLEYCRSEQAQLLQFTSNL